MRRLIVPSAVLAAAVALGRDWIPGLPAETLLVQVCRGAFAVAFLLAWRFRRGRIAAAALLLAAVAEALRLGVPEPGFVAVAVLVPLNLAVLGWLGDWRVLSALGAVRYGALALQAAGVALLARGGAPELVERLRAPLLAWEPLVVWTLPQPALAAFLLAAAALAACLARRRTPIEAGLLGALVASLLALESAATALYFGAAGLVLTLALVENAFSLAFEDGLTGLPARRSLEESLRHLGRTYTIAMVDLDRFKLLNDRNGHEAGDQVLRMVAGRLARVGGGGTAYRYGGEEFAVLFPGKSAAQAKETLEALRQDIAGQRFTVRSPARPKKKPKSGRAKSTSGKQLKVTVSIGVAERSDRRPGPEQVLKAADQALYRSKKAGRNRVTVGR